MEGCSLVGSYKLKNKLIYNVLCTLLITIACFAIISILTAKDSFSNSTEELWDGVSVSSSFSAGNGTEENPYVISNGREFAYFKKIIEESNSIYASKYYVLGNNINLDNHEWIAIGNSSTNVFKGYFDGCGYTIKNLKINSSQVIDDVAYYGIFSIIDGASIVNLNIDNLIITPSNIDTNYRVGTLSAEVKTSGKVSNISIYNSKIDLSNVEEKDSNKIGGLCRY